MTNAPLVVAGRSAETTPEQVVRLGRSVSEPPVDDPVEAHLVRLIGECDEPPLVDDLTADDLGTPCGRASLARAALCWLRSKRPEQICADMRADIVENDWMLRYRERQASGDLAGIDFHRIAEIDAARAKAGDVRYRRRTA